MSASASSIPEHLAVIPDGNRRWAVQRRFVPYAGHQRGTDRFDDISRAAFVAGVRFFTFWAASVDNLAKRSDTEVAALLAIFREKLEDPATERRFADDAIRFRLTGTWQEALHGRCADEARRIGAAVERLERATARHEGRTLTILFGYDGREDMLTAFRAAPTTRDAANLHTHLLTSFLPDVDLIIRTGETEPGWSHWSAGFLMWQAANAELFNTEVLWPDFTPDEFRKVLSGYARRARKRGA